MQRFISMNRSRTAAFALGLCTALGIGALAGAQSMGEPEGPVLFNNVHTTQSDNGKTIHAWGISSRNLPEENSSYTTIRYLGSAASDEGVVTLKAERSGEATSRTVDR